MEKITAITMDVGDKIISVLTALAKQLGTTAEHIFPWYVAQAQIEGLVSIGGIIIILMTGLCLIIYPYKYHSDFVRFGETDLSRFAFMVVIGYVVTAMAFLCVVIDSTEWVSKIFNPQYHAFHTLTSDISKLLP